VINLFILNSLGVKSLAIFGSVARGEADAGSDVDILVDFEGPATFDAYMETKFLLEELIALASRSLPPQAPSINYIY
jgi:predicted nucleotidyltransferase